MQKLTLTRTVGAEDPATACEFLAAFTPLSKNRIKDAMAKGAVWLKKSIHGQQRIRRASTALKPGDRISIYYDGALLARIPQRAQLISDQKRFSVWLKPAGLLSQGTKYGDHCALLRQVEQKYRSQERSISFIALTGRYPVWCCWPMIAPLRLSYRIYFRNSKLSNAMRLG